MKLDSETLEFVRAGLHRYPDARDTVQFFEETILAAISDALQRPWRTFRPSPGVKGGLAISKVKREYKGIPFLQVRLEGLGRTPEQEVRVVWAGIYWDNPVVAEVSLWDRKFKRLPLKPPASLAEGIWFNPSEPGLNLHVGKEFEPDADFKRLLDALEDAMESDA